MNLKLLAVYREIQHSPDRESDDAMILDRTAERQEMFEHIWRQTREKLYVADMDGVDWGYYRKVYECQDRKSVV